MGKDSSEPRISSTSSKERILTSRNGWILDQEGHCAGEAKVRANHRAKVITLTKGRGNDMMSYRLYSTASLRHSSLSHF